MSPCMSTWVNTHICVCVSACTITVYVFLPVYGPLELFAHNTASQTGPPRGLSDSACVCVCLLYPAGSPRSLLLKWHSCTCTLPQPPDTHVHTHAPQPPPPLYKCLNLLYIQTLMQKNRKPTCMQEYTHR